jgi:hypothetical protein
MLGAAMTQWSLPPRHSEAGALLPTAGRQVTNEAVTPAPKFGPLPAPIFIHFETLAMACVNFTMVTPIGLTGAFPATKIQAHLAPFSKEQMGSRAPLGFY